ncbi:MAG: hypothetical protein IMZ53_07140 [Thermoplasmata archaeon]|nr:hypothetical protein [Thermoplasmata archaeon]
MEGDKKVNDEIEQMLNALGDPTPDNLNEDEEDEGDEETAEEKAARELQESEDAKLSDEDKVTKKKEEDDAEVARLAEEEKRKSETPEEKKVREDKEAADLTKKEKEVLDNIDAERKTREKTAEDDRLKVEEDKKKNEPLKLDAQDFIGELDIEDVIHDKEAFNKLLNSVYTKGVNDSKKIATEGIPDIVKSNVNLLTSLKEASDNFYKENQELAPFKKVVAAVFEELAVKEPNKKYTELMNLVAPEARKRLGLTKQAAREEKDNKDEKGKPPRLHGAKNNQRQHPSHKNPSALESEISEMNKVVGR